MPYMYLQVFRLVGNSPSKVRVTALPSIIVFNDFKMKLKNVRLI